MAVRACDICAAPEQQPERGSTVDEPASSQRAFSGRKHMFMEAVAPEVEGMAPTQRFLLDMSGYLRIEAALSAEEVQLATEAVRAAAADTEGDVDDCWCASREMEQLSCFHPAIWPVVMELTDGKPKLWEGGVLTDDPAQELGHCDGAGGTLHCGRDDWGPESATFTATNSGTIRVNDFVVFIYLTDVLEGDGGLGVLVGSHSECSSIWTSGSFLTRGKTQTSALLTAR